MLYRIRKFLRYQGEGGRAGPDPRVQICISTFKLRTVTVQFKKSRNLQKMCELFNIFMKTVQGIFTKAPERDTKSGPDSRIRTHKKTLKMQNADKRGSRRDPDPNQINATILKSGSVNFFMRTPDSHWIHTYSTDPLLWILKPQTYACVKGFFFRYAVREMFNPGFFEGE
jgi:hypothetical protein